MAALAPVPVKALGSVLVTGGCGLVGSHIVELLKERYPSPDTTVAVLDLRTNLNNFEGVTYYAADLTSSDAVRDVFAKVKPNVVIHTASAINAAKPDMIHKVNVEGTKLLLEESKKTGVKAFVYTSSASVISDAATDLVNADERYMVIRGKLQGEYYSDTKANAEEIVLAANTRPSSATSSTEAKPLLTVSIRPSGVFGERDALFIPNLINVMYDGRTSFQLGDNDNLFDTTYAGNVAHAHILAAVRLLESYGALLAAPASAVTATPAADADDEDDMRVDGEAFFITNDSPVYFWDFTRAVWAAFHRASGGRAPAPAKLSSTRALPRGFALLLAYLAVWFMWIVRLPPPKLSPVRVRFSCMTRYFRVSKANAVLGYSPIWTLDEAVERSVRWFADRRFPVVQDNEPKKTK